MLFIIAFGIPLCVLPKALPEHEKENARGFRKAVDKVVSWAPYEKNRYRIDKILGSSFGLFYSSLDRANFYREPARQQLYIRAGMLEGCTVAQLNEVIRDMENYLARFDGISVFRVASDGTLEMTSYRNTGIHPRNFRITPDGRFLLVACRDSHCIQVFGIDPDDGSLSENPISTLDFGSDQPVCIEFDGHIQS